MYFISRTDIEGAYNPEDSVASSRVKCEPHDDKDEEVGGSAGQIITALRCRLKEKDEQQTGPKCLICMVSISLAISHTVIY